MKARVLKQIINDGKKISIGDIVEVGSWRNIKSLANTRYIELIEETPVKSEPQREKPVAEKAVAKKAVAKKATVKKAAKKK